MKNSVFPKVFMWMFIGLLVSFVTAFFVSVQPELVARIFMGPWYLIIILLELGLVVFLSARISKMGRYTAIFSFLLYAFVSGLTFSIVFVGFEIESIFLIFGMTSFLFLAFGFIGFKTKLDLSKWTTYLLMALLGIIVITIINYFLGNTMIDFIACILGVLLFVAFIAYDIQKIKRMQENSFMDENKLAIIGALELYLDFINLFLRLLRLFGKSKE